MKALADSSAGKEDLSKVRSEIKRLYDGLHVGALPQYLDTCARRLNTPSSEFLDLRSHVWGIRE